MLRRDPGSAVYDVLGCPASGMTTEQIVADLGELPSSTFVQRSSSPHYVNADSP